MPNKPKRPIYELTTADGKKYRGQMEIIHCEPQTLHSTWHCELCDADGHIVGMFRDDHIVSVVRMPEQTWALAANSGPIGYEFWCPEVAN